MFRYELPLSKVVQDLRQSTLPDAAFRNVKVFLDRCTTASVRTPESLRITLRPGYSRSPRRTCERIRRGIRARRRLVRAIPLDTVRR